ncbi:MAG TPA: TIGR01777 family oxidoreductase [Acidimicrobiales bacterium]|nr:TIGR01777 family oxidoreductase [Acidimicrobiales bacterium]
MIVLVSGAGGLIGRALAAHLRDDGHRVVRLVRPGSRPATGNGPAGRDGPGGPVDTVRWDPAAGTVDRAALDRAGPFDAVVHLAGAGIGDRRWTAARRRELWDSRVSSTRLLAATVRGLDPVPRVLVSASAVGWYGDRGDEVLTEDAGPGRGFLADLCQAWEREAEAAAGSMRVVRLRSGVVLSGDGGALGRQLPLFRLGLGGRLGSGRQYVSWISLADHLGVVRAAIDDDRLAGPVNATAPRPVTNAELTRALGRALHRPAVLAVPGPVLSVALGGDLAREMVLAGQRAVPDRLAAVGHRFTHPDVDSALAAAVGR